MHEINIEYPVLSVREYGKFKLLGIIVLIKIDIPVDYIRISEIVFVTYELEQLCPRHKLTCQRYEVDI